MEMLEKLGAFLDLICPYHLRGPVKANEKAAEHAIKARVDIEMAIDGMLREWGT